MRLSANFTLEEFTTSQEAARRGIENAPGEAALANLRRLANRLEAVRSVFGYPIVISSGYRSPALNAAVGGAPNSAHMTGCAADLIVPGYGTPIAVCQAILGAGIPFDQLIHEFGRWVHFAVGGIGAQERNEALTICSSAEGYKPGILDCDAS